MPFRRRKTPSLSLTAIFALALTTFTTLAFASSNPSSDQDTQDKDSNELICHTENPEECYPKIFIPTDEFKTVQKDQEIPQGLHVRLNVTSGLLEAKINVEGESPRD